MKIIGGKTCNITCIFHNDSFIEYCHLAEEDRVFDYKELRAQLPEEYEEDPVFDFKELSAQLPKTEKGNCRRKIVPVFKQDGQEYAQVVSMSNKDRCEAMCIDGRKKMCYLSGKMYKKVVVSGDIVLVGLRDYHDEKADVILKYELPEAKLLKAYGELPENISLNKGSLPIPASAFQYSLLGSLLLQKQLKDLCKHPVVGFSVCLMDEKDLFRWSVLVFGPPDTLYEGGFFGAFMSFPSSYPNSPPTVWFTSRMWHPNVYVDGRVCISILAREGWSPVYTVEGIVLSIISMLSSPNYESPANVDAAKEWRDNRDAFKKKVARCVRTSQEML